MGIILSIAAGGALGAVMRHGAGLLALRLLGPDFPWATMGVNILGSFLMGLCVGLFAHVGQPSHEMKAFITVGVLGGFTTFSTFSLDTVMLWERGDLMAAGGYALGSVVVSIAALMAGLYLIRSLSL
jgi:CrcB protein